MKEALLIACLTISQLLNAQARIITGKVLDEDLGDLPLTSILGNDTVLLGKTDLKGNFQIELPANIGKLKFTAIGMEDAIVTLQPNCATVELILQYHVLYHQISHKKIDRLRKRRFDKLDELYLAAIRNKQFSEGGPCYSREFVPHKPSLDRIQEEIEKQQKEIKDLFKKLKVGDSLIIPFPTSYRDDRAEKTTLHYYSFVVGDSDFDCVIEVVVIGKDRTKGGYNITCRVTTCACCKLGPLVFEGKDMINGRVFKYNMKYFKVLTR
ncbi:MAG: hypothetical protein JNN04_12880 [Cyclobacteriaceae bacterium]|nr:hypothetical protein [Cyclobacteriaceae bacterium]